MLERLRTELAQADIARPGLGASTAEIAAAEAELGVRFPRRYVEFLKKWGVLHLGDRSVFGLGPRTRTTRQEMYSVVFHTRYQRAAALFPMRPELVVLWHESGTDCECLDTGRARRGDCPVVHLKPGRSPRTALEWTITDDLDEWILSKARHQLKTRVLLHAVECRAPRRRG